ncbi:DUF4864 domain-containing protein [Rhizobium halophytocola]|uniref:DUF4864 domain-containing protein n=1 Tax=Rhizobium halophytocola TaxID=735519 RepID=A0ABS4DWS1_9HYPH|nr:DUF4864 domain-containing protein [Rhizobium halophytocola]MBP1850122.1 hypothetical protein [Rhizobium halophytocola]
MPGYRLFTPLALSATLCALLFSLPAKAADAMTEMRAVISGQLTAFINKDTDAAFSYASPAIKKLFREPQLFGEMVRRTYEAVYSPGSYAFGEGELDPDEKHGFQVVLIADHDGRQWAALYELERQPDGVFAINGVRMLRDRVSNGI